MDEPPEKPSRGCLEALLSTATQSTPNSPTKSLTSCPQSVSLIPSGDTQKHSLGLVLLPVLLAGATVNTTLTQFSLFSIRSTF